MKISTKGTYALSAIAYLAKHQKESAPISILTISKNLNISKIYLEQIFSILKAKGLITSIKGKNGGYYFSGSPSETTAYDVLSAIETSLFEKVPVDDNPFSQGLNDALWQPLHKNIIATLKSVSLKDILDSIEKHQANILFYI